MARRGGRFGATGFSIADGRAAHRDRSRDRCRADGTLNHTVSARPPSRVAADFRPVRLLPPPLEVRVLHPKTGLANVYEQAPCRLTLGPSARVHRRSQWTCRRLTWRAASVSMLAEALARPVSTSRVAEAVLDQRHERQSTLSA